MIRVVIKKRTEIPKWYRYGLPILSIVVSVFLGVIIISFFGLNPLQILWEGFIITYISPHGWVNSLIRMIPLLLVALGLAVAFKTNVWNIGAEGQIIMGAAAATWIALFVMPDYPAYVVIPTMYLVGFLAGALWAFIPGFLKAKFDVNEILTTIMMNYIAFYIVSYLVVGPWRGKNVYGYDTTDFFGDSAKLPIVSSLFPIPYTSLMLSIILVILMYYMLYRTKIGFELRAVGSNPKAAELSGISRVKAVIIAMVISGGLAGLAGVNEVGAIHHQLKFPPQQISGGYGFTGIIVAFLGNLDPIGVLFAAFFVGMLITSSYALQILGVRSIVSNVFSGLLLMSVIISVVLRDYKIEIKLVGE